MSRPALEVADIFRGHGPAWRQANAGHVSLEQLKVMNAIESCRHWRDAGLDATVAVNVHVTCLEQLSFADRFMQLVTGAERDRLALELLAALARCHVTTSVLVRVEFILTGHHHDERTQRVQHTNRVALSG